LLFFSFLYSGETMSVTHTHRYIYKFDTGLILACILCVSLSLFCKLLFCFSPSMIFFYHHQRLCMRVCVCLCVFLSNYRIVMDRNRVNIVLTPVSSSYFSAVVCVFSERTQLF
jgi:hypothetical protein